jgi:dnd system-associated protein 4
MRELVCFAAVLGFEHATRKPLHGKTLEIDARIFGNSPAAVDTLYLVALATERNADILRDENVDKMVSIFEEYAEGGFQVLGGWLREKPEDVNGDRAILAALAKYGFLEGPRPVDAVIPDLKF